MCGIGSRITLSILNGVVIILGLTMIIVGLIIATAPHLIVKVFDGPVQTYVKALGQDQANIIKNTIEQLKPITRPVGWLVFFLGVTMLGIAIFGFIGATCNKKLFLKIYVIILSVIVLFHIVLLIVNFSRPAAVKTTIRSTLEKYVKEYKSIQSGEAASVFLSILMASLECCGVDGWEDFKHAKQMSKTDKFLEIEAKDLKFPLMCCKVNTVFKPIDADGCTKTPNNENSNTHIGCAGKLELYLRSMIDKILYGSLIILGINMALILLTVFALI